MNIPKKFTINGQTINVEIVDELDSEYGNYNDAKELIRIARTIKEDKETIRLSQLQIENTFWQKSLKLLKINVVSIRELLMNY